MLGVTYLAWMGVLDLSLAFTPPNVADVVGGLVLGVRGGQLLPRDVEPSPWVTAHVDALGLPGGHAAPTNSVFAELFPLVRDFFYAGSMGAQTIPGYFGLPWGVVAFRLSCSMALGGFAGAGWLESALGAEAVGESMRRVLCHPDDESDAGVGRRSCSGAVALLFGRPQGTRSPSRRRNWR